MTTLSTVIVEGLYSAIPAFGIDGRLYFATDTKKIWYDTGSAWVDVTPTSAGSTITLVPFTSTGANQTIAHGLGTTPAVAFPQLTSLGIIAFQTPQYDATNLYIQSSDPGITGFIVCLT